METGNIVRFIADKTIVVFTYLYMILFFLYALLVSPKEVAYRIYKKMLDYEYAKRQKKLPEIYRYRKLELFTFRKFEEEYIDWWAIIFSVHFSYILFKNAFFAVTVLDYRIFLLHLVIYAIYTFIFIIYGFFTLFLRGLREMEREKTYIHSISAI